MPVLDPEVFDVRLNATALISADGRSLELIVIPEMAVPVASFIIKKRRSPRRTNVTFVAGDVTSILQKAVTLFIHCFRSSMFSSYTMTSLSQPSATSASYIDLSTVLGVVYSGRSMRTSCMKFASILHQNPVCEAGCPNAMP